MSRERIRVGDARLYRVDLRTRMPFRFGIASLVEVSHLFLQLDVFLDGRLWSGLAAEHLLPKWFSKNPDATFEEETAELQRCLEKAVELAQEIEANTVFSFWRQLYERQLAWGESRGLEPLLSLFGATVVERALMDAFARSRAKPLHILLKENAFGIDLGAIHPELADTSPADFLPPEPLASIRARHTVGLTDPLREADIGEKDRLSDGLPQSLEACIAAYGLSHFKIKVCADPDRDLARLRGVSRIVEAAGLSDSAYSLDGNEQFTSCRQFREFWGTVCDDPNLRSLVRRVMFIEQPFHRNLALSDEMADLKNWNDVPPIIIDESDGTIESLPRALELGYAGVSHKNCKGIIRGIVNRCLLTQRQRNGAIARAVMSGEDLVNIGPLALLQDLALQAALGNASVERNGHHYFSGLSAFSRATGERLLEAHADLFRRSPAGWPTVRIERGWMTVGSVNRAPFGYDFDFPMNDYPRIGVLSR